MVHALSGDIMVPVGEQPMDSTACRAWVDKKTVHYCALSQEQTSSSKAEEAAAVALKKGKAGSWSVLMAMPTQASIQREPINESGSL